MGVFNAISPLSTGDAATVVLITFAVLAGYDGVNLHLVRYRLWERPESRGEHLLHTARSVAFPLIMLLLFTGRAGVLLWLGVVIVIGDTALGLLDVRVEPRSRRSLGGLSLRR
jgi:hypothetical protein